jgi:hypothetical protein
VTTPNVAFAPVADPLLREPPITHEVELPVLGIRTRFETNSESVMTDIEESFGCWRDLDEPNASAEHGPLLVRIVVYEGTEEAPSSGHVPVRHACPDATRLFVQSSHAAGISDPERREAVAFVDARLVADHAHFRSSVLDALTWSLLSHFDRHPIHAAAVATADRALLLAAPSGTGKSTVAWLAHRSGLELLSDDRVWVQLQPTPRVWSAPRPLRFLTSAADTFPEFDGVPVVETDGKRKLEVLLNGRAGSRQGSQVATCIMSRGDGPARLERATPPELESALLGQLAPGFDRFPERQRDVMKALAAGGGWHLTLGSTPHEALPFLAEMLAT